MALTRLRKQTGLTQVELAVQIDVSKSQYIRYETKEVMSPANTVHLFADTLGTFVDYLISGDRNDKAKTSIINEEILQQFTEMDTFPEEEQFTLIKVISAYIRDFKAKQAYMSREVINS